MIASLYIPLLATDPGQWTLTMVIFRLLLTREVDSNINCFAKGGCLLFSGDAPNRNRRALVLDHN